MVNYIEGCRCGWCNNERKVQAEREAAAEVVVKPVPTSRILTREMLLKGNPCYDYRTKFCQQFPGSVEVTLELALSQKDGWDWQWAGYHLLSKASRREFDKRIEVADSTFDETMRPYWDLYNAAYNRYYEVQTEADRKARNEGLSYTARYAAMAKATAGILEPSRAAQNAAQKVADETRDNTYVIAFVELFLADEAAYTEEHKDDAPFVDPYDEQGYDEDERDEMYDSDYYDNDEDY